MLALSALVALGGCEEETTQADDCVTYCEGSLGCAGTEVTADCSRACEESAKAMAQLGCSAEYEVYLACLATVNDVCDEAAIIDTCAGKATPLVSCTTNNAAGGSDAVGGADAADGAGAGGAGVGGAGIGGAGSD